MRKSYSKIRHIQESNMILEFRRSGLINEDVQSLAKGLMTKVKKKCPKKDEVVKGCIETLTSGPIKNFLFGLFEVGIGSWYLISGIAAAPATLGVSVLEIILGTLMMNSGYAELSKINYKQLYNDMVKVYNCAKQKISELTKTDLSYSREC